MRKPASDIIDRSVPRKRTASIKMRRPSAMLDMSHRIMTAERMDACRDMPICRAVIKRMGTVRAAIAAQMVRIWA